MKIAINQSTIMQCQTERFIAACGRAGFRAVELRIPKLKESLYHLSAGQLRRRMVEAGIEVISLNAIDDFAMVPQENLELLRNECELVGELAGIVDCPVVVAPVARWFGEEPEAGMVLQESAERLRFAAEVLAPYGVKIGLEPIGFPEFTVRELAFAQRIIDAAGLKEVGLVPDVYNLARTDRPESLEKLRYPAYLIHINDVEDMPAERLHVMYHRVLPGEGTAHPQRWVEAARKGGFDGWFSLELFRRDLWEMEPEEVARICYLKLNRFAAEHGLG